MEDKEIPENVIEKLIKLSSEIKTKAYCPYSKFRVGAALLCKDGTIFTGCNVESPSHTPTICAERAAVGTAVSRGYRDFTAIAVASDLMDSYIYPCGVCRQVLIEFNRDTQVFATKPDGTYNRHCITELLPHDYVLQH